MKIKDLTINYETDAADVLLTVIVGDGQIGTSAVLKDSQIIGQGGISKLSLGAGPQLHKKQVVVKTIVSDVNDKTDKTSVTYALSGGKAATVVTASSQVDKSGDSMVFRTLLAFP